ncbi:hypothetical protein [Hymenobacter sp. BT190]|uniref:hypothetical protein n=1 Tax=Hymenobacter sp. BT190 TaxID=2763505 RepID=UPI0016512757|nr:hypothetical protein [Hymenobacter sp. BT190]MBC6696837.1 hypothetical protein [Hymenobacter sp. BT190]
MKNIRKAPLLLVAALFFFTSCDMEQEYLPAPQAVGIANAASAPVPCASEGYEVDANGVGAYQLPNPRYVYMTNVLTGLSYNLHMTQTKYIITPNGKELSVWQGTDTLTPPSSKITFTSTAWSECNKGYASKAVRYTDGKVTSSLTSDPNVLPFEN